MLKKAPFFQLAGTSDWIQFKIAEQKRSFLNLYAKRTTSYQWMIQRMKKKLVTHQIYISKNRLEIKIGKIFCSNFFAHNSIEWSCFIRIEQPKFPEKDFVIDFSSQKKWTKYFLCQQKRYTNCKWQMAKRKWTLSIQSENFISDFHKGPSLTSKGKTMPSRGRGQGVEREILCTIHGKQF